MTNNLWNVHVLCSNYSLNTLCTCTNNYSLTLSHVSCVFYTMYCAYLLLKRYLHQYPRKEREEQDTCICTVRTVAVPSTDWS